jgi:hypothetical protein
MDQASWLAGVKIVCIGRQNSIQLRSMADNGERTIWEGMKSRCRKPRHKTYAGLTVCAAWQSDFEAFLAHIGPRPSPAHSVDRIDNARGYEPGNVRWATKTEQMNNRYNNRIVTAFGRSQGLGQWCDELNLDNALVYNRIYALSWSPEVALSTPARLKAKASRFVITVEGETGTIAHLSKKLGVNPHHLYHLVKRGVYEKQVKIITK